MDNLEITINGTLYTVNCAIMDGTLYCDIPTGRVWLDPMDYEVHGGCNDGHVITWLCRELGLVETKCIITIVNNF